MQDQREQYKDSDEIEGSKYIDNLNFGSPLHKVEFQTFCLYTTHGVEREPNWFTWALNLI